MEPASEPISERSMRLSEMLSGPSIMATTALSKELLFDSIILLFDECNNEYMKTNPLIVNFINKFKMVIPELKSLRVNRLDFESKQVIGKGHFGHIELVIEKHTKDIFAMKVLKKDHLLNQRDIAFFEYERDIMALSNSQFLTQLHYAFQDFQNLYLIMDYHPGGDFANLIDKFNGTFTVEIAKFYTAELLLAVKHLHIMGFAHRDIKPENMMIDRAGHLKLVDFGSSAKLNRDGKINTHMSIGTSEYLAPEILMFMQSNSKSLKGYGPQCDLWSVGIVAYEMITGDTPFNREQQAVIYPNILDFHNILRYPTSLKVPSTYRRMIECLVCHVDKRFTVDMILDLEIFSNINFNTLHNQVPPYIPSLVSDKDVSNFPIHERVRPALNINDFKKQKQFSGRDIPFIGFTYNKKISKHNQSYFMTNNLELESSIRMKRKEQEDANVLIQTYEDKLIDDDVLLTENEKRMTRMEEDNDLSHIDMTSLSNELGRLSTISETSNISDIDPEEVDIIDKKQQTEMVKNEIDKWEINTINELYNTEEIKTLNEDLQAQNNELQSQLFQHQNNIKMYQANEEELNKKIIKLESKIKHIAGHSKQLIEDKNIDDYVVTLINEIKMKEDAFGAEKTELNINNQCLKKKILVMEKDIDNLNSKISQYADKEITLKSKHDIMCKKLSSDFQSKLNSLNQDNYNEIEKLHAKITQLQNKFSESLDSFEKHENSISTKEIEKEFEFKLKNQEQEIHDLKLDLSILQKKHKTSEKIITSFRLYEKNECNSLNQKIIEIQEETNLQIENEEELKLLQNKVINQNKIIESLQLKLDREIAEHQILSKELSKINNECMVWASEKSVLERQILEYKTEFDNSEKNIKGLQKIITIQDKQHEDFEKAFFKFHNKGKTLLDDIKTKQNEIDKIRNELHVTKKMYYEDKCKNILTENRVKSVESMEDNFKIELKSLKKRIHEKYEEIDSMKNQLDEVNSKLAMFYRLKIELNKIKLEMSETISQKQLLKESIVGLTAKLEVTVEDSNVMQNVISKYKNVLLEQKIDYEERLIKTEATIFQQTKHIDFLQTKLDEVTKKKKTFGDMLFSSKNEENIDRKEMESLLNFDMSKSKDLATKLYQTQIELNMGKTQGLLTKNLMPNLLNFEIASPTYSQSTPVKSQPVFHSFDVKICKRGGLNCSHCKKEMMIGQQITQCQECRVSTHITCSHELLPDCNPSHNEEKSISLVLGESRKKSQIESWVSIWDNTKQIWDRKYAKFEHGVFQILNDKRDTQPFYTQQLIMTSFVVKIVDVAKSNDSIFDKNTNEYYKQMLKIEVYNLKSRWIPIFLYIIVSSVSEKLNWLKIVKEFLEKSEMTVQSLQNHDYKDIVYTFKKDKLINVNCIHQISQNIFLLGAAQGLFSVYIHPLNQEVKYDLVSIDGPKLIEDLIFLPKLQLVLMIAGTTKEILKCNMRNIILNSELSPTSKPVIEVIRIIDEICNYQPSKRMAISELKDINCITASSCNKLIAVGSEYNIIVLKWQDTRFLFTKILKTNVPTKCICFMSTGIIFTTNSFYKLEINNFNCKRFFTDSVAKSRNYRPMFVCELTKNKEYLLCYNVYGIFVDADGKRTRSGEMKWLYSPNSFAFKKPFLIIVSQSEISIIKITRSCCMDEDIWSITSTEQHKDRVVLKINHPTLLGSNDIFLKNTSDYQGTCSIFHLDPFKFFKNSMASNDTLSTLDTHDTCDESEWSFTSSMSEHLDEELG